MMISHGIKSSIAGCVEEMVCDPKSQVLFLFLFYFFIFCHLFYFIVNYVQRLYIALFMETKNLLDQIKRCQGQNYQLTFL